jgi:hypothetical protein
METASVADRVTPADVNDDETVTGWLPVTAVAVRTPLAMDAKAEFSVHAAVVVTAWVDPSLNVAVAA